MPIFVPIPAVGTFVTFPIFSGPFWHSRSCISAPPAPGPELVATRPVWGCGSIYKA